MDANNGHVGAGAVTTLVTALAVLMALAMYAGYYFADTALSRPSPFTF
jgi:hypothetical protein